MEARSPTMKPEIPTSENHSNSSSLTLSITPPLSEPHKDESSTISEHLSSIENDRSTQEVEVNFNEHFNLFMEKPPDEGERISQEPKPPSLNSSSIISLNGLDTFIGANMESRNNAQSILEEILNDSQFKSDEESLDIFANVDLDDRLLNSYNIEKTTSFNLDKNDSFNGEISRRVRDFEELIAIKDTTIAALTSELDSFRELVSNTSSNSLGTSTTEYKQFQEECHHKLVEYHNALVHKDDQIEKLTNSLQQAILTREEMKQHFKNEIGQLQEQLEKTSTLLKEHNCSQKTDFEFGESCSKFEAVLDPSQISLFYDVKMAFTDHFENQKKELEDTVEKLKSELEEAKSEMNAEILRLKELLDGVKPGLKQELDAKHSKEMEELRTYFEKKCVDLEKNYSEEIFSQQSRKMSASSSCSETELSSDFPFHQPGPGGDAKIEYTKKDIAKLHQTLSELLAIFNNVNLSELSNEDFDRLKSEIGKVELKSVLKYDLVLMRSELQNKYHAELEILREDFDNRVDLLNVEHDEKLRSLEKKYVEEIEDLNVQLRGRIVSTAQQEVRLVASDSLEEDWPEELLQLKARFAKKYQQEIDRLNDEHSEEILRLKEEHVKTLKGALERARRRSLRDADSLSKGEIELLKERDGLKRQCLSLRNLLGELIKYFTQCEDELNNTLVEELITKNVTQIEKELEETTQRDSLGSVKRVHITPNFNDLINLIDNSSDNDLDSVDLKSELGSCLEKLKSDANAILTLSTSFPNEKIESRPRNNSIEKEMTSLTRKLINETQIKNNLYEQLNEARSIIQSLETDRATVENQLEALIDRQKVLESDLLEARGKIAELIENGHKEIVSEGYGENGERTVRGLAEAVASLVVLQDKVRSLSENSRSLDPNLVRLIEDLSRVGDKIVEEAKKDKDELKQQVEHLEHQLRDMSRIVDEAEKRCKEAEEERKEAVDKIFELRDIIRHLEEQVKTKTNNEEELRDIVNELEVVVRHQNHDKAEESRDVSDVERLHQYVGNLESEVQKLRLSSEIAGSEGALQQIKNHLCDFETTLDKRTKDLEGLHSTISTTCSSPSEDMSIRDVVPDRSVYDECEVPLQQLARLKEKLLRHSRAEDAALKRIRDLELHILGLKSDLEESQHERDILKKQISDYLVLISNLQIRLDEQRIRAEHIEKQTNTSLEVQNYDLKNTIVSLEEKINKRDKTIAQLKADIEETKQRLEEKENEPEDEMLIQMQEQLEILRSENMKLKANKEVLLPNLVENIISEKNNEIERIRSRLAETENHLELFTSLNLDKREIDSLNKLRLSGISFHDIIDLENLEKDRRERISVESFQVSPIPKLKRHEKTTFLESQPEISSIEKVGSNHFYSLQIPHAKANSTEKHVRFEDEVEATKISELQKIISEKDEIIRDYDDRVERFKDLETKVEELEKNLEETEANLKKATESFEKDQKESEERAKNLRLELASMRCELTEKEDQIEEEKRRALEKELKSVHKLKNEMKIKEQELRSHEETLKIQNDELKKLQDEITSLKYQNANAVQSTKMKDGEILKLKKQNEEISKELFELQNILLEKDKVIQQIEADSKSLRVNLETIQSKMLESGNVIDLGKRLREEQKRNSDLYEELHVLKAQLLGSDKRSLEDIAQQVQRELDYSAHLDATLINAVSDGSLENEDLDALRISLKKQKSINKQLVKNKELVERKFEDLEQKHENLKRHLDKIQYEDAMLIGELRTKLDSTMQKEVRLEKMLKSQKDNTAMSSLVHRLTMNSTSNSLPELHHDYQGVSKMMSHLEEDNNDLKKEIRRLNESNLAERALRLQEVNKFECKLSEATSNERFLKQNIDKITIELDAVKKELAKNKQKIEEIEQERRKLLKEQKPKSNDPVPEELIVKIRELGDTLKNDRDMMALIERLRCEKIQLVKRIAVLEDNRTNNLPFDDPVGRANYLFAKYLRSESYRKALAWQKLYLISLLESYQIVPCLEFGKKSERKPKNRFKCVAVMVVSICRMKYLVRRWHSGKRIAEQRAEAYHEVQFQVGQPVSSQNFTTKSALNQAKTDLPWFGTSPPSKEPSNFRGFSSTSKVGATRTKKRFEPSEKQRSTENLTRLPSGPFNPPLTSPNILSKYIERYNLIQDKYGLDH